MKKLICVGALLLVTGCIPSLHAIYHTKDLVFDPQLVGEWNKPGDQDSWKFTRLGTKSYRFTYTDKKGKANSFKAHMAKCGDLTVLDLLPEKEGIRGNEFYKTYLLPLHTFFLVERLDADNLILAPMDHGWLKRHLKNNPGAIAHENMDGTILLTAPTEEMQDFLLKHHQTHGAFAEPVKMIRR